MSLRKAATSIPSDPLLSCVLRLSVASHAAVCAPALGASLTFCQRSVRLRCRPAERLGGLGDRCERSVHVGSADPMPNPSSPFMSQRGPTRNVSSPHHHHHHHHHRTFGHKRTTCSELSGGRKKKKQPGDYFTHYCTGDEQRSPETRFIPQLLGRADIGGACQLP